MLKLVFVVFLKLMSINAQIICIDDCTYIYSYSVSVALNGVCDESDNYGICYDCTDCGGPRNGVCKDECEFILSFIYGDNDGYCEDSFYCSYGHDCTDCGPRGTAITTPEPTTTAEATTTHEPTTTAQVTTTPEPTTTEEATTAEPTTTAEATTTQTSSGEVECTVDGVIVTVSADDFPFGNTMLLGGDINCAGTEIIDGIILYYRFTTTDLQSCGLSIVNTTADYIVYHTVLAEGAVTVMDIYCNMERRSGVDMNITVNPCLVTQTLEGFGTFDFLGSWYEDENYIALHDPDVPVDMCDTYNIYFGIDVDYDGDDVELFVEYCYVVEDPDDIASPMYYLINDGCYNAVYDVTPSNDNAVSPLKKNFCFSGEDFVYNSGMTKMYIRCGVVICDIAENDSRCSQGCFSGRMERAEHTSESTIITQGPYPLQGCAN